MKKKNFKITDPSLVSALRAPKKETAPDEIPKQTFIEFPPSSSSQRVYDFGPFYGKGYNDVVIKCQSTIVELLARSLNSNQADLSVVTVIGYCNAGLTKLFKFCEIWVAATSQNELKIADLDRTFILAYMQHLASNLSYTAQRSYYLKTKSVLTAIKHIDLKVSFPKKPYPNINKKYKGETAYTPGERRRLAQALSAEIHRIKSETGPLSSTELGMCLLWISTCTGLNAQPLFELRVDALQPHPFHPHKRLLVTYKRRGKNTQISSLRGSSTVESAHEMAPRVDSVFRMIEQRNLELRIKSDYPESLFIFQQSTRADPKPARIKSDVVQYAGKLLAEKYILEDDKGQRLVVNISKLRKTFSNRVFELSGHDPIVAAALAGHSVKVSDDHYLAPPVDAEKDHAFMGEVRNRELLSRSVERTSVASCQDSRNGHRAPKNGKICLEVFGCFKCQSFVVTGDDLHKLFSFYNHVASLRSELGAKRWNREYSYILRIIDRDIAPKFEAAKIQGAKELAASKPHLLWRSPIKKTDLIEIEEVQ